MTKPLNPLTVIDAFCGAGGMSLGFVQAGFELLYSFDKDIVSLETYKHNFPSHLVEDIDVNVVTKDSIKASLKASGHTTSAGELASRALNKVDIMVGGPPCQGFSSQNSSGRDDSRNKLASEFLRLVGEIKPHFFLMENVRGLMGIRGDGIVERCSKLYGYRTHWNTLDAYDFGVAQIRKRVFVIGTRDKSIDHDQLASLLRKPSGKVTKHVVRDLIFDIQDEASELATRTRIPNAKNDMNSYSYLSERNKLRLNATNEGEGRDSLPEHLQLEAQKRNPTNQHTDTYGRLSWDKPAVTLTTAFNGISKGRFAHPAQCRGLTLREGARLQGFEDDFEFYGLHTQVARQIGNSVCPPVAKEIADRLLQLIHKDTGNARRYNRRTS